MYVLVTLILGNTKQNHSLQGHEKGHIPKAVHIYKTWFITEMLNKDGKTPQTRTKTAWEFENLDIRIF